MYQFQQNVIVCSLFLQVPPKWHSYMPLQQLELPVLLPAPAAMANWPLVDVHEAHVPANCTTTGPGAVAVMTWNSATSKLTEINH